MGNIGRFWLGGFLLVLRVVVFLVWFRVIFPVLYLGASFLSSLL